MLSPCNGTCISGLTNIASLRQRLNEFAVELRQLAYTMPGGHEDPLIHLSERMVSYAREQTAEQQVELQQHLS